VTYIVIDFEFNQPFDFPKGTKTVLVPGCPQEIMQIGAVKLDGGLAETDRVRINVRPSLYPRVHPFVSHMTGIKNRDLNGAWGLPRAYRRLAAFMGRDHKRVLCFWGPDDVRALFENIECFGLDERLITRRYINVQKLADAALGQPKSRQISLKSAAEAFGVTADFGKYHDALNDALYTAEIFRKVKREDTVVLTYVSPPKAEPFFG
jgi:inhibitor of KinA sporulation pathway (predicted exonuclease)